jgi:hypothetical protein
MRMLESQRHRLRQGDFPPEESDLRTAVALIRKTRSFFDANAGVAKGTEREEMLAAYDDGGMWEQLWRAESIIDNLLPPTKGIKKI